MTREQKDLLLKDLSRRLLYGVKIFAKYVDASANADGLDIQERVGTLCQIDTDRVLGLHLENEELVWNEEIVKYMSIYNVNYNEALLYRIRNFFAFECAKLPLIPPIYSRKLYKMGFIAPTDFGNSYKLANYKANKFFNKK